MNGLLLPVKGLTCTSASPQGDPQPHMHLREPTRRSPAPHAHPRAHKEIASPTYTSAIPQGDRQTRAHMRKTTRKSTDSRAHPRAHKESRFPRTHPRAHARIPGQARRTAVRVAPLLTSTTTPPRTDTPARAHSPVSAERSHGLVNWRGEKEDYRSRTWCLSSVFRLGLRAKVAVI